MTRTAQLRLIFDRLAADERLDSTHVALFSMLTRHWKEAKYAQPFPLNDWQVRQTSKIRSLGTYQHCLKELEVWGYVRYFPSQEPDQAGVVSLCGVEEMTVTGCGRKRKRRLKNTVLPQILDLPREVELVTSEEIGKQVNWMRLTQLIIQASIQLLLVALNKHLNIF
ncbi:MAG: hypothetical protein V4714_09180 [Bacteroidota bacterium]